MKTTIIPSMLVLLLTACGVDLGNNPASMRTVKSGCYEGLLRAYDSEFSSGDPSPSETYLDRISFEKKDEHSVIVSIETSGDWEMGSISKVEIDYQNYNYSRALTCEQSQGAPTYRFLCEMGETSSSWSYTYTIKALRIFTQQSSNQLVYRAEPYGEDCYSSASKIWHKGSEVPTLTQKTTEDSDPVD